MTTKRYIYIQKIREKKTKKKRMEVKTKKIKKKRLKVRYTLFTDGYQI